jgi:hypothetical protein
MRKSVLLIALGALFGGSAIARDTILMVPLAEVMELPEAKTQLDGSVKFFLAGSSPVTKMQMGEGVSNKKTNGANKDDRSACKWAALSALLAFQQSARNNGADAVVDMVSYYKRKIVSSPTDIECHAGGIIVGVALKGTYAKL